MNKGNRQRKGNKNEMSVVPLWWRILSWVSALGLAAGIFWAFYNSQAQNPHPNPYHPFDPGETALFGFIFAVGGAFFFIFVVHKVLLRIAQKRSSSEIVKEVAKDVAVIAAVEVIDVITGSSGSSSSSSGSSSGAKGGGGEFGGGGATGDF